MLSCRLSFVHLSTIFTLYYKFYYYFIVLVKIIYKIPIGIYSLILCSMDNKQNTVLAFTVYHHFYLFLSFYKSINTFIFKCFIYLKIMILRVNNLKYYQEYLIIILFIKINQLYVHSKKKCSFVHSLVYLMVAKVPSQF